MWHDLRISASIEATSPRPVTARMWNTESDSTFLPLTCDAFHSHFHHVPWLPTPYRSFMPTSSRCFHIYGHCMRIGRHWQAVKHAIAGVRVDSIPLHTLNVNTFKSVLCRRKDAWSSSHNYSTIIVPKTPNLSSQSAGIILRSRHICFLALASSCCKASLHTMHIPLLPVDAPIDSDPQSACHPFSKGWSATEALREERVSLAAAQALRFCCGS